MWDSLAICETLAERHPEAKLWPDDPLVRAEARAYAAEMHSGLCRCARPVADGFRAPTSDAGIARDNKAQIARIISAWTDALESHTDSGGFLFGRFSIADCMYAPVVSRFRTYGMPVSALVKGYCDRIWMLPGMRDWEKGAQAEVDLGLA